MKRNTALDPYRRPITNETRAEVVNRLKTARGHLDSVISAIDDEKYVLDVLRQIVAVRGALDATVRVALRYYFDCAFAPAVAAGKSDEAVEELMNALAFLKQVD